MAAGNLSKHAMSMHGAAASVCYASLSAALLGDMTANMQFSEREMVQTLCLLDT
jgi:hypothetical protein